MALGIWQLILIIIPVALGILLKGIIKKFVIWSVDVVCAIGFILLILVGGVGGFAIDQEVIGGSGGMGVVLGIIGGIVLGTLIFGFIFVLLSIDNTLRQIKGAAISGRDTIQTSVE